MTLSLRHNDVLTLEILDFYEILRSKLENFWNVSDCKKKRKINDTNWKETLLLIQIIVF